MGTDKEGNLYVFMANRLRQARRASGLTQAQFAERLDMSARAYADAERAKGSCSALALAEYLAFYCHDVNEVILEFRKILHGMIKKE